jgi:hypothetical protein
MSTHLLRQAGLPQAECPAEGREYCLPSGTRSRPSGRVHPSPAFVESRNLKLEIPHHSQQPSVIRDGRSLLHHELSAGKLSPSPLALAREAIFIVETYCSAELRSLPE